jgi:hypothetical protein
VRGNLECRSKVTNVESEISRKRDHWDQFGIGLPPPLPDILSSFSCEERKKNSQGLHVPKSIMPCNELGWILAEQFREIQEVGVPG